MKDLIKYIKESNITEWSPAPSVAARTWLGKSVLGKSNGLTSATNTVKHIHHILDIMYEMAENKEKNFGIKFDEICGNLISHIWEYSSSLKALEDNKYIKKYGNIYNILLTTTTKGNTIPCEVSVPIYELTIPNTKTMQGFTDEEIKEAILKAAERLKKTVKLY